MICPQCGYDIGNKHHCQRCGYEIKTLVTVDEAEQKKREKEQTKVIDPSQTYMTDEYGNSLDEDYFDPFAGLFGSLFDPLGDLLGGLFGFDPLFSSGTVREQPQKKSTKSQKDKVVEVREVEIYDENDNFVKNEKQRSKLEKKMDNIKRKFNETKDAHRAKRNVHGKRSGKPHRPDGKKDGNG